MDRRVIIGLAAALVAAAALAAFLIAGGEEADLQKPPATAQSGVDRVTHRPTTKGADTLLKFTFRLDMNASGTQKSVLACKGKTPLSGSSGLVFSDPSQSKAACAGEVGLLKNGGFVCPDSDLSQDSGAPWVKVSGVVGGVPVEETYVDGPCGDARRIWEKVQPLWMWDEAVVARALLIPLREGQAVPDDIFKRATSTMPQWCEESLPEDPLKPCLEEIPADRNRKQAAMRAVALTDDQLKDLDGASAEQVREVLEQAETVELTDEQMSGGLNPTPDTAIGKDTSPPPRNMPLPDKPKRVPTPDPDDRGPAPTPIP